MRVWIVDDDELFHVLVKRTALKSDLDSVIESFFNGKEASDQLAQLNQKDALPQIVILDINMPLYDGWHFMMEFAKLPLEIREYSKIYICSSSIAPDDRQKAHADPYVIDFIEKPISMESFATLLGSWWSARKRFPENT
jgi:CheY-like chemotaxis protein